MILIHEVLPIFYVAAVVVALVLIVTDVRKK